MNRNTWKAGDGKSVLIQGDCIDAMDTIPDGTVQTCVTSPPYFGLRDYGHSGQIGLERTPDEYVSKMVDVFRAVRRVLRDDGTVWLNLGDSYAAGGMTNPSGKSTLGGGRDMGASGYSITRKISEGTKPKDLLGIPWRVAFALQADGWYLRQDIIWHKPNPMPESVTDRCTKAHEYIFMLSKSKRYFYDHEAIKEPQITPVDTKSSQTFGAPGGKAEAVYGAKVSGDKWEPSGKRNKRSVWTVTTKPFSGAHFAVFPPDLIEPCILAGCPEGGTVLDPFTGSGTTALVAIKHRRNFIGTELNPEYFEMAGKRIEDATAQRTMF